MWKNPDSPDGPGDGNPGRMAHGQRQPPNMGVCIVCFLRDIAGALRLHTAPPVQYLRPEILGLVLGAFAAALAAREFRVTGGAGTLTRFVLGILVMIGFLVFLGCPLRTTLRLAAGDLNALVGSCNC